MMKLLDQFDFHHSIEATRGAALVTFTAPLCGSCNMLREALESYGADHPDVALFEVDTQRDPGLGEEFEVFHLPALFLYVDGDYQAAIQCEALPEKIDEAVQAALRAPREETP